MTAQALNNKEYSFTDADFDAFRTLIHDAIGIRLDDTKRELLYGRLSRRLRHHGLTSFDEYRKLLESKGCPGEFGEFTNAVTTNLTAFFREGHHFDYLRDHFLVPRVKDAGISRRLRIWCCASSTGEEPYSIAMTVAEAIPDWASRDIRVLATDIDTNVLATAQRGIYNEDRIRTVPPRLLEKYFTRLAGSAGPGGTRYQVKDSLMKMITFRPLNLIAPLPMSGPLDVIFCRNVIIYFDKPTQKDLFHRVASLQAEGGLLFLGHSENLLNINDSWSLLGKTIYRKNA